MNSAGTAVSFARRTTLRSARRQTVRARWSAAALGVPAGSTNARSGGSSASAASIPHGHLLHPQAVAGKREIADRLEPAPVDRAAARAPGLEPTAAQTEQGGAEDALLPRTRAIPDHDRGADQRVAARAEPARPQ